MKKAQAAMEFLMTYGWALLVVLIAIGALAAFGVLNPTKLMPESCVLGSGLACKDFKVDSGANKIQLTVTNGLGTNLDTFLVYVDKQADNIWSNELCGGYVGYISIPNSPLAPNFLDGESRSLSGSSLNSGIDCPITLPPGPAHDFCCAGTSLISLFLGFPICSPPLTGTNVACYNNNALIQGKQGQRFSEDIVIVYKETGSSIIHKRIGHITTKIE